MERDNTDDVTSLRVCKLENGKDSAYVVDTTNGKYDITKSHADWVEAKSIVEGGTYKFTKTGDTILNDDVLESFEPIDAGLVKSTCPTGK